MLKSKLCFVQFIHPGGEHRPDHGSIKDWNRGPHKRKFMSVRGRWVGSRSVDEGRILFWGEWEAQSTVAKKIEQPLELGPSYIYRPFYLRPRSYRDLQNTDPFVFEQFFYTGCQQHTVRGPTQLRYLSRGSVILFGSCVGTRHFALDTVFVVDDWIDHHRANYRKRLFGEVPKAYEEVTLRAWYGTPSQRDGCSPDSRESFRLYRGATHDNPVRGMFSFVPCLPEADAPRGFCRPLIQIPGVITDHLQQGKRLNRQTDERQVAELWRQVVQQVRSQRLRLGIYVGMPPRRGGK